jgi:hypothetical protein
MHSSSLYQVYQGINIDNVFSPDREGLRQARDGRFDPHQFYQ